LLTEMMVGMGEGFHVGGLHGAALAGAGLLGKTLVSRMREAGIAKANTLVRDAMLNPELAAMLLKRAPIKPGAGIADTLTRMLARIRCSASRRRRARATDGRNLLLRMRPADASRSTPRRPKRKRPQEIIKRAT
jgi:hypothetical protein